VRLAERVAIVTGGGTGIGRAISLGCAAEGAAVVVGGRRPGPVEEVAAEIAARGGRALAVAADAATAEGARRLVEAARARFGRLDVLVNAAGVLPLRAPLGEVSDEIWTQTLDGNLTSVYQCCKAALPALLEARGCIVNVASVAGLKGVPRNAPYATAKAAVVQLTRTLAVDYAARGVRVNAVCPGFVETDMNRAFLDGLRAAGQYETIVARHPLGFLGAPEDVAHAVLFLASDEARWITGVALPVDGGAAAT